MTPTDWNTLIIICSAAIASGSGAMWLNSRFSKMEEKFYRALEIHKREDTEKFETQAQKIQRLELRAFGFTKVP